MSRESLLVLCVEAISSLDINCNNRSGYVYSVSAPIANK